MGGSAREKERGGGGIRTRPFFQIERDECKMELTLYFGFNKILFEVDSKMRRAKRDATATALAVKGEDGKLTASSVLSSAAPKSPSEMV